MFSKEKLAQNISQEYPKMLKSYRQRHTEVDTLKKIMDEIAAEVDTFKSVKSCLSVGTGYGEYEIEFIKRCLPNLKRLVVVEQDHDCVEDLKVNLNNSFGEKLQVEIHEMSIENFMKNTGIFNDAKIDIVIAFHVLYFLTLDDLRKLVKLCFNSDSGLMVFVHVSKNCDLVNIVHQLGSDGRPFLQCHEVKDEIKEMGLVIKKEFPYDVPLDLREYGEDINDLLHLVCKLNVTHEKMREAVKRAAPSGWGKHSAELCIVEGFLNF